MTDLISAFLASVLMLCLLTAITVLFWIGPVLLALNAYPWWLVSLCIIAETAFVSHVLYDKIVKHIDL